MKSLNIIGAGKLGKVIGKALVKKANLNLLSVLNKTVSSSNDAINFINTGSSSNNFEELKLADIWMVSVPDDEIDFVVNNLLKNNKLKKNNIIFHCSGSYSSNKLKALKKDDIYIASIHPIKSFVNADAYNTLEKTYCSIEGDKKAVAELEQLLHKIGLTTFEIKTEDKTLYHAGCVFTCNYITALFELGLNCFKASGINEELAKKMISPLIKETIDNNLNFSTLNSLSGPVKRGDYNLIKKQLDELKTLDSNIYNSYKALGKVTLNILKKDEGSENYSKIKKLFE